MGMDVYGKAPTNEAGKYFRNNCWWWRPLWRYCCELAPGIISDELEKSGQYNDGAGLDAEGSKRLAGVLRDEVSAGRTKRYADRHKAEQDALPDEICDLCGGTGTRTDMKVENGCNKCLGKGKVRPYDTWYPFSVENVEEFATFLEGCGGFEIN